MPERRLDPHLSQWIIQSLSRWLATYAIIQGAFIVLGGPARWQGPSFATALLVPGAPASWGVVLCILGVAALAGTFTAHYRTTAAAVFCIGAWAFFFAISVAKTAMGDPNAATTGIFVYGHQAVTAVALAIVYWRVRRR